jgi:hypothetical protein
MTRQSEDEADVPGVRGKSCDGDGASVVRILDGRDEWKVEGKVKWNNVAKSSWEAFEFSAFFVTPKEKKKLRQCF